jgi:hypothetical protein
MIKIKLIFQNYVLKNFSSLGLSLSLVEVTKTLLHEIMLTEKGHQEMFYGKESQRIATRFSSISTIKLIFQNDIVKNFSSIQTFFISWRSCQTLLHEKMLSEKEESNAF